jgi:hypothetical protein
MHECPCIRYDDKAAWRLAPKGDDGRFDFYVGTNGRIDRHDLERQGRRIEPGTRAGNRGLLEILERGSSDDGSIGKALVLSGAGCPTKGDGSFHTVAFGAAIASRRV